MKFLLFNIVVAVALVYLVTGDKADFQTAANRTFQVTNSIKEKAFEAIGAKTRTTNAKQETATVMAQKTVKVQTAVAPKPEILVKQVEAKPVAPEPMAKAPQAVSVAPTRAEIPRAVTTSPEVARRRAEVLDQKPAATTSGASRYSRFASLPNQRESEYLPSARHLRVRRSGAWRERQIR